MQIVVYRPCGAATVACSKVTMSAAHCAWLKACTHPGAQAVPHKQLGGRMELTISAVMQKARLVHGGVADRAVARRCVEVTASQHAWGAPLPAAHCAAILCLCTRSCAAATSKGTAATASTPAWVTPFDTVPACVLLSSQTGCSCKAWPSAVA